MPIVVAGLLTAVGNDVLPVDVPPARPPVVVVVVVVTAVVIPLIVEPQVAPLSVTAPGDPCMCRVVQRCSLSAAHRMAAVVPLIT